jgi:hypothetical protein
MGLFNSKEEKANKEMEKVNKYLEQYKLQELDEKYYGIVKEISREMAGSTLAEAGMALSGAKPAEQFNLRYMNALIKQNWIIIGLQQELLDELKKKNVSDCEVCMGVDDCKEVDEARCYNCIYDVDDFDHYDEACAECINYSNFKPREQE